MKKFIKDWWPLLLIAGWLIWKKRKTVNTAEQTPTRRGYGSETDPSNGNVTEWWYDEDGLYHMHFHLHIANGVDFERKEGDPCEKNCYACGSPQTYQKGHPASPHEGGAPYILREVCSNPNCKTHYADY